MDAHPYLLLFLSALAFSYPAQAVKPNEGMIGAIVDNSTRIGKEEAVAMEMAIEDFCNQTSRCLDLLVTNSNGEAAQATLAGILRRFSDMHASFYFFII